MLSRCDASAPVGRVAITTFINPLLALL